MWTGNDTIYFSFDSLFSLGRLFLVKHSSQYDFVYDPRVRYAPNVNRVVFDVSRFFFAARAYAYVFLRVV